MKKKTVSYRKFWMALSAICAIAILILSVGPISGPETTINHQDKINHFIAYGTFSYLAALGALRPKIVLFTCTFYGIMLEVVQYFLPHRDFNYLDLMANIVGCLAGTFLGFKWRNPVLLIEGVMSRKGS